MCGNQDLIAPVSCKSMNSKKKNNILLTPIVASVVAIFVVLTTVAAIFWGLKRKRQHSKSTMSTVFHHKLCKSTVAATSNSIKF